MANRAQRRQRKKKNKNNDHDMVRMLAKSKTLQSMAMQLESNRRAQRLLWISVLAINEAFGIGAGRVTKYLETINALSREWDSMACGADDEYADEKLRLRAEKVCGQPIPYLFEDQYIEVEMMKNV